MKEESGILGVSLAWLLVLAVFFGIAALLTGCGHNVATNAKGVGIRMAWTPDSLMPELNLGYFETGTGVIKENASFEYESAGIAGLNGESAVTGAEGNTTTRMKLKTAEQVTGYAVELEEAKAGYGGVKNR